VAVYCWIERYDSARKPDCLVDVSNRARMVLPEWHEVNPELQASPEVAYP
jgi:hypothetical protein